MKVKVKVKVKSLSLVRLFTTPWTAAYQASPSMGFSRQEYWSGVPLTSPIMLALPNYKTVKNQFSSVTQLCPTLRPHGLQHARLPCPSLSPRVRSNSCPLSQWCHPTISSSVAPFSSRPQSFPASGSFPVSQLFISGSQSTRASASASVLPVNIQDWFPLGLTSLISLLSKGLAGVFSSTTIRKHQFFRSQPSLWSNSHICTWLLEKP